MTERIGRQEVFEFGEVTLDVRGMYRLAESYIEVARTINGFIAEFMQKQGNKLLRKVRKRTPVGEYPFDVAFYVRTPEGLKLVELWEAGAGMKGGNLKRSWRCSDVEQDGRDFKVTVFSMLSYAPYVEYGHRTVAYNSGGRIVGWWEGHHMGLYSLEEVEREFNKAFENAFLRYLRSLEIGTG